MEELGARGDAEEADSGTVASFAFRFDDPFDAAAAGFGGGGGSGRFVGRVLENRGD